MIQWTRLQTNSGFQAQWPVTFHTDNVFPFATMNAEPAAYCSLAYETKSNINIYYHGESTFLAYWIFGIGY